MNTTLKKFIFNIKILKTHYSTVDVKIKDWIDLNPFCLVDIFILQMNFYKKENNSSQQSNLVTDSSYSTSGI